MSIAPVVFRPKSIPNLAWVCLAISVFLVLQGGFLSIGETWPMVILSLVMAAAFAALGLWYVWASRHESVLIDGDRLVVKTRTGQTEIDRNDIASVDLRRFGDELTLSDGTSIALPLEGDALVQASLLLAPGAPGAFGRGA